VAATSELDTSDLKEEPVAIKRLLALDLLRAGATQAEVAAALEIDMSTVSRMFPSGVVTPADH
jgi:hypothetical protein